MGGCIACVLCVCFPCCMHVCVCVFVCVFITSSMRFSHCSQKRNEHNYSEHIIVTMF